MSQLAINKVFDPSARTKTEALLFVMDHSRAGAVVQLAIMEGLNRAYQPEPKHRPGETNLDLLSRLLTADRLLGRTMAMDAVRAYCGAAVKMGKAAVLRQFEAVPMINGGAWFTACEDVIIALDAAMDDIDPNTESTVQPWEEAELSLVLRDGAGRVCERLEGPASEMIKRAAQFMTVQGTDPDEDGAGAQAGRIDFAPI